jgi:hypothetical protein
LADVAENLQKNFPKFRGKSLIDSSLGNLEFRSSITASDFGLLLGLAKGRARELSK